MHTLQASLGIMATFFEMCSIGTVVSNSHMEAGDRENPEVGGMWLRRTVGGLAFRLPYSREMARSRGYCRGGGHEQGFGASEDCLGGNVSRRFGGGAGCFGKRGL